MVSFGYGNHACPGRFYAVREVKLIFARLILGYDLKWDNPPRDRPPPFLVEGQFLPNMKQKVLLRRRRRQSKTT